MELPGQGLPGLASKNLIHGTWLVIAVNTANFLHLSYLSNTVPLTLKDSHYVDIICLKLPIIVPLIFLYNSNQLISDCQDAYSEVILKSFICPKAVAIQGRLLALGL